MDTRILNSPTWFSALSLAERGVTLPNDTRFLQLAQQNVEQARRRFERWRSQPPFDAESYFQRRLALDHIEEEGLLYLLGEPMDRLQGRLPDHPDWLIDLAVAYRVPASAYAELLPDEEVFGFLELVQPLIDRACERLRDSTDRILSQNVAPPFDPDAIEDILLWNLPEPVLMELGRTMALELNVARLEGKLDGATPQARFANFVALLREPDEAMAILATYPILAQQLTICIRQWADSHIEFIERLCADWEAITALFSPSQDPGQLIQVTAGAGDPHRDGRTVMIAEFESGFRIVYKPKSMAVDVHFQELLKWLNEQGCDPPLRTLKVLGRVEYGWVEYISYAGCNSAGEIERFFLRLGTYLALFYALNATDFHFENLIAAGEYPMPIDLETLFHPPLDPLNLDQVDGVADQMLLDSVLQPGLLPQRLWANADYVGIDISGLGAIAGQLSPDRSLETAASGTDNMRYVRQEVELTEGDHRPNLNGEAVSVLEYGEVVVEGFVHMYQLLCDQRNQLLADDGPLARFSDDEVRVLLRPTRTYSQLLVESFHPDMLRDGLERDRFLDHLWIEVMERPYMARVIVAEQDSLRRGDIPLFTTRPMSRHIWHDEGDPIQDFFGSSGMDVTLQRIHLLGDQDMQRQIWIIRASLATLVTGTGVAAEPVYDVADSAPEVSVDALLDGARAVAERLSQRAIEHNGEAIWLGLESFNARNWSLTPLGLDLFNGLPGITLFLAYAGALLEEERYTALARRSLAYILRQTEFLEANMVVVGAFQGWGGWIYMLTQLSALWDEPALLERAQEIGLELPILLDEDETFDIMGGSAGALRALLVLHRSAPSVSIMLAAIACGEHLLKHVQPMETGMAWPNARFESQPLTGFANGASGIACALLELAAVSGQERFAMVAKQAMAYERSLYSESDGKWPDLRPPDPDNEDVVAPGYAVTWAHGAAGIGLARLQAMRHLNDPQIRLEVDNALATTRGYGFGYNHSLSHGDLGNLELLFSAAQVLDDAELRLQTNRLAAGIMMSIDRLGWRCGVPEAVETPGLMLGLAGIGYQLLRLASPARVPCVLLLDPPPDV